MTLWLILAGLYLVSFLGFAVVFGCVARMGEAGRR